jgi:hypothetical protein
MPDTPIESSIRRRKSTTYRFDISPIEYRTFIEGIRLGLSVEDSAWNANLTPRRVWDWLEKGEIYAEVIEDLVPHSAAWQYARFLNDFKQAEAQFEALHVANITNHARKKAEGDWTASRFMLLARRAEQYSEKYQLEKFGNQQCLEMVKFFFEIGDEDFNAKLAEYVQLIPNFNLSDAS